MSVPSNEDVLSRTIMFLRFPLIVAVVFIHTIFYNGASIVQKGDFYMYDFFYHIISDELARVAVPLFFFMSGFLFYYHSDFSFTIYRLKLKRRIHTLLIPYIFWNIVVLVLLIITQLFLPSMTSGRQKLISEYNWMDWINIFWNHREGQPLCFQFWFIRDLMVLVLFSPLVYYFIRTCRIFGLIILGILWIFEAFNDVPGGSITAFFFFSFGAWFSINNRNFTIDFKPFILLTTVLYLFILVVSTLLWYKDIYYQLFIHNIGIILGLIMVVTWTAIGFEKRKLQANVFLANSAFVIYAYHGMPIALVMKLWMKLIHPITDLNLLTGYFLTVIIIVIIGVVLYAVMRKYIPCFTNLITGGRNKV